MCDRATLTSPLQYFRERQQASGEERIRPLMQSHKVLGPVLQIVEDIVDATEITEQAAKSKLARPISDPAEYKLPEVKRRRKVINVVPNSPPNAEMSDASALNAQASDEDEPYIIVQSSQSCSTPTSSSAQSNRSLSARGVISALQVAASPRTPNIRNQQDGSSAGSAALELKAGLLAVANADVIAAQQLREHNAKTAQELVDKFDALSKELENLAFSLDGWDECVDVR